MKIKILLMMMIFLITTVVAYPVSFWITSPNGDFSLSVYRCTSHACTTIDSFLSSSSGFINEFTIPSSYTGTNYFAMYAYKNGFVPHTYRITTFGDTGPGPWENAIQFYKDNNCYSNIQSLILSTNSVQVGQSVQIDATVQSVYVFNDMVKVIPTALRNHYSNVVDVMLYVDGQLIETKQTNIVWNESRQLSFSYTPTSLGSKQVQIRTRVDNDNACTGTTEVVRQSQLNVIDTSLPHVSASGSSNNWFNTQRVAVVSASDSGSGLAQVRYSWGTNQMNSACTSGGIVTNNGASLNAPIGGTTLYLCARDNSGNVATWNGNYRWETTAPICGSWSPSESPWKWSGGQLFTLSGSTDQGGSGINIAGGSCTTGSNHGDTCSVTISDNAGNTRICTSPINRIDNIPPHISASGSSNIWFNTQRVAVVSASDSGSGLAQVRYSWGTNQMNSACTSGGTVTSNGASLNAPISGTTLYLCARDNSGNVATWNGNYRWETTAPICGSWSPSESPWKWSGGQLFTLSGSTDQGGSGINIAGGSCTTGSNHGDTCSVTISDSAGNTRICTSPINRIDNIPPHISASGSSTEWFTIPRVAVVNATDSKSGIVEVRYSWGTNQMNSACTSGGTVTSNGASLNAPIGGTTLYLCARDAVGNNAAWYGFYNWDYVCYSDSDCGLEDTIYACNGNYQHVATTIVPTCFNPGTVDSVCFDIESQVTELCNHICDDALGCDYTQCSDGIDNDGDGLIDYPEDPGCESYYDDDESSATILCFQDLDCGIGSLSYSCVDGNHVGTEISPTCFNPGTKHSFCFDVVSSITEICDYVCDDILGCDYAPVECSSDLDCGVGSLSYSCVDGNYVTTETVPTCFNSGTVYSFCFDVVSSTTEICDYVCDDALGCDYAPIECSSDLDCGSSVSSNSCVDGNYVTTTSTPTCYNPGTIGSYCEDVVSSATEICDYICDDALGCDYAPIECSSDLDCGLSSLSYSCVDGNYVTTETVPTCFNSGTVYSFCFDIVSSTTEICDYACDDALGCDYAPIECSSDLDCGLSSLSYSCVDGNYVTTETVPTCFAAGTIDSYCEDVFSSTTEICEYSCDETFGCIVPELEASLSCFDNLVVGNEQVCSVFVNAFYGIVSDAMVSLYAREIGSFGEPVLIGTCITDLLSGGCQVQWVEENLGESEVFALVTKDGHIDADIGPFSYMVYSERYEIFNLKVFSDNNYLNESYDFFRGEDMYVSFNTWDLIEQDWAIDLVSLAVLTSPPGGMAYLDPVSQVDGEYRFRLTPIPPTHEFLGDSQVFTFVFNFSDASGGQANVNLIIRNNIPVVFSIPNQVLGVGESVTLDLDNYGYDIEDELIWVASNVDDSILEVVVQENELYILGLSQGENLITLTAFDLNNDFASTTVLVTVLPIECSTNLDCGVSSLSYSCVDGNYVTTETVPTCFAAGTIDSYCEDVLIPTVEICDYACDDVLGCDYAPIECSTDLDCGVSIIGYSCDNNIFTTIHVTPVCVDAGTINSYCSEDVNIEGVACNYICSVDLGCDYAPIECSTDLDCGVSSLSYSCVDGNYVTTETVPTCFAAGTIDSYCEDVLIPAVEICDYACDDALGCDYAPVQCSTDLDCGVSSLSYSCVDGNYVTTETVPTCFAAGTIDSYCEDVLIPIVEICDYACDDVLGCDYAPIECSTDLDCGVSSLSYSCVDGNYVTTETVPTCYNAGVIGSYCVDLVVPTTDICAYTCDDTFGCDNMQALSTYADLLIENFVFIDGGKIVGLEDAVVHSGDDFTLGITFRNRGNTRLENVRILAAIPELGISRRIHRFDVEPGERVSTHVALWVPYDVVPDEYIVRLIVYDKDVRRVQHRYVTII